ncbi:glycosyltransferase [Candidatus Uhrbacteria bacterium]|nr:glycosyltransferase [Candidatus Uhrbacteria bacterium]
MKILFDARPIVDAPQGGVGRVAFMQAKKIVEKAENDVIFFTTGSHKPQLPTELLNSHTFHKHIHIPNKIWSLLCIFGFRPLSWFIREKPDSVMLPNIGFIGAPTSWKMQLIVHDLSFLIEPKWFRFKQMVWHRFVQPKKLFQEAHELLCVSERTKKDLIQLVQIHENKCHVIHMEKSLLIEPEANEILEKYAGKRIVLAFGAHDKRKNFLTAEIAVKELQKENAFTDIALLTIGRDVFPTDEQLAALYSQASALLYPSWYEGFGLPLHEASRYGCRVVASTAGALPETAPEGTVFANPAKPQQWVEALRIVLTQHHC